MTKKRDRNIDLEDLADVVLEDQADAEEFDEFVSEEDLLAGVAGCFIHPAIPCMESCRAYNLYKDEDEPNCRVLMALEKIPELSMELKVQKERNHILSKLEKTMAAVLQHLQRLSI